MFVSMGAKPFNTVPFSATTMLPKGPAARLPHTPTAANFGAHSPADIVQIRFGALQNDSALRLLTTEVKKHPKKLSVKYDIQQLGETLQQKPASDEARAAVAQLVKYIDEYDSDDISSSAAKVLGEAAKKPAAWAVIKEPLLALIGTKRENKDNTNRAHPIEDAVTTAASYQHTWPEILDALLRFFQESGRFTTTGNSSSYVIGRMAAKYPDIWKAAKAPLFESLQAGQPSEIRQKALLAICYAVQNRAALWPQVKAQVVQCLEDPDMAVQANAVEVLSTAAKYKSLAPEVLSLLNGYLEAFKKETQPKIEDLVKRAENDDYDSNHYADKIKGFAQDAYKKLAERPGAWQQMQPIWESAFLDKEGDFIRSEYAFIQTILAAAQHPQNWEGAHNVKKYVSWALETEELMDGVSKGCIEYTNNNFLWSKLKPTFLQWIKHLSSYLESEKIEWTDATALIRALTKRIKQHPEEWSDFEASISNLWQEQLTEYKKHVGTFGVIPSYSILECLQGKMQEIFPEIETENSLKGELFREYAKCLRA